MWLFWVNVKRMCFYFAFPLFLSFSSNEWLIVVRGPLSSRKGRKSQRILKLPFNSFMS